MTSSPLRPLGVTVVFALVLFVLPGRVLSFGTPFIEQFSEPVGLTSTGCLFVSYNDPAFQDADMIFFPASPPAVTAGGNGWLNGEISTGGYRSITAADLLAHCPFDQVLIIAQNGADGPSYVAEDYIGIRFSAVPTGGTQNYVYEIAMIGAGSTFVINTRIADDLPVANAGQDQLVASAAPVQLDGSGSTDSENPGGLSYAWSQFAGPAVSLSDATSVSPMFTAPTLDVGAPAAQLGFRLVVNDGTQNSLADEVIVTVLPPENTVPTADAGPDQVVSAATQVALDGTGSDANDAGQSLSFAWTQVAGPSVTLSSASAAQPTFTAPIPPVGGPNVQLGFSLIVNDGIAASAADQVTVTVEAPTSECQDHPINPIVNCSFETGDTAGWTVLDLGDPALPVQVVDAGDSGSFFDAEVTDGARALVHGFDGAGPDSILLWQEFTVVEGAAPSLSFDYRAGWSIDAPGATSDRAFLVQVEPVGGGTPLQSDLVLIAMAGETVLDTGPQTAVIDLTAFAGQAIRLVLRWDIPESFTGDAQFQVDRFDLDDGEGVFEDGFETTGGG